MSILPLRTYACRLSALLLLLPVAMQAQQAKLVEKFKPKANELGISYERYELPNGLTVLVHEDHSDPVAYVDLTYHVGSAREEIGKSGFAHFFEHMMFQGSDNVADEEHFKIVTAAGGTLNGSTNRDRTNYYQTVPNNQVELMLWLEADRMGFLLDAVTKEKFEVQRATVKNERGQNYDNRPYGLVREVAARTLYPYGHPYSWLTIGYIEDLNRSNLQDLKNFFLRWYGPNNAVLTVAGDVSPKQVVAWAEKYFGSIPRGPKVEKMSLPQVRLSSDRYTYYEDKVPFPQLNITWPTVPDGHPDEEALSAVAATLGQGRSSMLYERLVKSGKAQQALAFNSGSELAGEFSVVVLAMPTLTLPDADAEVRAAIKEFADKGMSQQQLDNWKASTEAALISQLSSVQFKGAVLASNFTYFNDPDRLQDEINEVRKVTLADVKRVFDTYVNGKGSIVVSVVPQGKADAAAKPKEQFKADSSSNRFAKVDYSNLAYTKAKDNFERKQRPGPGANPVVKVPKFWTDKFANGISLIGASNNEVPQFTVLLTMEGGRQQEMFHPGKAGIARLTNSILNEGTKRYTASELAEKLRSLGASISFNSGDETFSFQINGLVKNLDSTLALAQEVLFNPRFDAADFGRLQRQQTQQIKLQANQPTAVADNVFSMQLLGEEHPLAGSALGTEQSIAAITLDDVKEFYNKHYAPAGAIITVVGDVSQQQIVPKLGFLRDWNKPAAKLAQLPALPKADKVRLYLIDKPGAAQSEIRVGHSGMPFDATGDYFKFGLANFPVGGSFNSRINLLMREAKGWTYGARASSSGGKTFGTVEASAGVLKTATDSSVAAFVDIMKTAIENGLTQEEVDFMKTSVGQREALRYESNFQKALFLTQIPRYNLPADFTQQQNRIIQNATKAELDAAYKKVIRPGEFAIVVVGDKQVIGPGLQKLGYEIVELDANGKRIAAQ